MADALYRQIADDLQRQIEAGELGKNGEKLPTEIMLSDLHKASRNTVREAIKLLTSRGLVETRAGKGTFVVEKIDPFIIPLSLTTGVGDEASAEFKEHVLGRLRIPEVRDPVIEIKQAEGLVAAQLALADGDNVVSRHQRRFIDSMPWSMQTSFYPMDFALRGARDLLLAQDMPKGVVSYLQGILGIQEVGWKDRIKVRASDLDETTFFRLPDDGRIAVIEIQRTGYQADGTPLRLTVTVYPADRNELRVASGEVPDDAIVPLGSVRPEQAHTSALNSAGPDVLSGNPARGGNSADR